MWHLKKQITLLALRFWMVLFSVSGHISLAEWNQSQLMFMNKKNFEKLKNLYILTDNPKNIRATTCLSGLCFSGSISDLESCVLKINWSVFYRLFLTWNLWPLLNPSYIFYYRVMGLSLKVYFQVSASISQYNSLLWSIN